MRIGRELLAGLAIVHDRGLVHCDVKAANVMLGSGPAKLIDFGIAEPPHDALESTTSLGTLQAMSPEQLHGEALTPASDLFSLATVLYEALAGRPPYPGQTPEEVSASQAAGEVVPPSSIVPGIPDRLDGVILQALRRDPRSRFHTAAAMSRALELAADSRSDPADDETRVVRTPPAAAVAPDQPSGYVPPPMPDRPLRPARRAPGPRRTSPARRGISWTAIWSLLVLGAAALVVVLVVLPLLGLGPGETGAPSPTPDPETPSATVAPGVVPDTIGRPTDEAIQLAEQAGLDWTVRCNENPEQPEGIIDQEPPAGTEVAPGSQFTMFSARIADCR